MNYATQTLKRNDQKNKAAIVEPPSRKVKPKSSSKVTKFKVKKNAAGFYEWQTMVTESMARSKKPQVLVSFINICL
jgi:hypothetical protein